MKYLLARTASAAAIGVLVSGARAQTAAPVFGQPQLPPAAYPDPYRYRYVAPTPDDAYRQGLINRWELEQLVGPTPPALQGPSANGSRDFSR